MGDDRAGSFTWGHMMNEFTECPECKSVVPTRRSFGYLTLGQAMSLLGAMAMIAAFAMPWFGVQMGNQGIVLSGQFLARFLSGTPDLRQFIPGASGGPNEVMMLRGLVLFFPSLGVLAAVFVAASILRPISRVLAALVAVAGVLGLAVLAIGISRLPPNASVEIGLWVIGAGAIAIVTGAPLHLRIAR